MAARLRRRSDFCKGDLYFKEVAALATIGAATPPPGENDNWTSSAPRPRRPAVGEPRSRDHSPFGRHSGTTTAFRPTEPVSLADLAAWAKAAAVLLPPPAAAYQGGATFAGETVGTRAQAAQVVVAALLSAYSSYEL